MAAAARILYVGDDTCHRIPVMESTGIVVLRSECSVAGLRTSFAKGDLFSAVTFHNDFLPPADAAVTAARELCRAPLILFRNPAVECDERVFDLVIPVPASSPEVWAKSLETAIQEARRLHEYSRQLRQECTAIREQSRVLREASVRNRISTFDYNALFRAEADGESEDSDDKDR